MTPWIGLVVIHSVLNTSQHVFHVGLAANPLIDKEAIKDYHREALGYKDYRRIHGYGD